MTKYALFSWVSPLGCELKNLCSFSFTYFQSPGEVIESLHKISLDLTVSSANTKRVQSFENMMSASTLINFGKSVLGSKAGEVSREQAL